MLKGNVIRLQPWFKIRRVSWLYIVAYTNGCHKDYKGDWLHRGLLHSFWRQEILVWNLGFISPEGQFDCRYVIPIATRHIVQSSLKVQDGVSFFFKMESARPVPFLPHTQAASMAGSLFANYVIMVWISRIPSFPGGSDGKESACNVRDRVEKIPWRREWLPTPVSCPGEFCGQRTLAGYSPWGRKESGMTERLSHV